MLISFLLQGWLANVCREREMTLKPFILKFLPAASTSLCDSAADFELYSTVSKSQRRWEGWHEYGGQSSRGDTHWASRRNQISRDVQSG
ncbi:hypothetical protein Pmani_035754 [Petrolisthes manimaculis]|uniref:Uncharacterized protein n=1 Tax=Petrolisthes manimaculis TaxID=1843537 RepID=A0AAE1NLR9_9EUCA|nr:hypothetical protein Pmani_035754 [Petrolisthes manimaculis]